MVGRGGVGPGVSWVRWMSQTQGCAAPSVDMTGEVEGGGRAGPGEVDLVSPLQPISALPIDTSGAVQ